MSPRRYALYTRHWSVAVFTTQSDDDTSKINCAKSTIFIARQHTDARYWYSKSVCLSVCLSVTFRYHIKTAYHIVIVFPPYVTPIILVLPASNIFTKFRQGHPLGGAKYTWDIKISRFSTNKSLYLANDTRYRYSYYGRRIGTRMRSIKWCHFPLPWTNSNHVFRDTPLFDAKYLTNG